MKRAAAAGSQLARAARAIGFKKAPKLTKSQRATKKEIQTRYYERQVQAALAATAPKPAETPEPPSHGAGTAGTEGAGTEGATAAGDQGNRDKRESRGRGGNGSRAGREFEGPERKD